MPVVLLAWLALALRGVESASQENPPPAVPLDLRHAAEMLFQHHDPTCSGLLARRLGLVEASSWTVSVGCIESVIGSAVSSPGQGACHNFVWNVTAGAVQAGGSASSRWTAAANIDPIYGSTFPWDSVVPVPMASDLTPPAVQKPGTGYTAPVTYTAHQGLPLAPQPGWGGGPNVSLGPPAGNTVWGVHSTPSTAPGLASGAASVLISWLMGAPTANVVLGFVGPGSGGQARAGGYTLVCAPGSSSCALGTLQDTAAPGAFVPKGLTFAATIMMGTTEGSLAPVTTKNLTCLQYLRVYNDSNYLSPYICHVTVPNLVAKTTYYYTINATVSGAPAAGPAAAAYSMPSRTVSTSAMTYKVTTFSAPSTGCPSSGTCSSIYPVNLALMGDVGQTFNSSLTAQYLATYLSGKPVQAVLNMGDFTYADNFGPSSTYQDGNTGANPWKWDSWATMWQSVLGQAMMVTATGNHEIESLPGQAYNSAKYTDNSTSYGLLSADQRYPYQASSARFPTGGQVTGSYGDLWAPQYFSQNLGPVHLVTLSSYVPFVLGTEQYAWFQADMAKVDRQAQPWLIVQFHVPIYHTYQTHYKEAECFRGIYEPLFYQYKVDFVLNGHVHAYERTHAMYNYSSDSCGPVYITIGDGGNVEGPYRNFMDEVIPNSTGVSYCQASSAGLIKPNVSMSNTWTPSYQRAAQPPTCTTLHFEPAQAGTSSGILANPYDPSGSTFWCQKKQPWWSAYRDPSFGFAALTLTSDNTATYSWYRSIDQNSATTGPGNLQAADTATYTRYTGQCPPASSPAPSRAPSPAPSPAKLVSGTRIEGRGFATAVAAAMAAAAVLNA